MDSAETKNGPSAALSVAEQARLEISPTLDTKRRSTLGQFMTPAPIASFMAGLFDDLPEKVHLLDAGAGVGALTAAFAHEVCGRSSKPRTLDVTAFEVDPEIADLLEGTLAACAKECSSAGVAFTSRVVRDDFILHSAEPLFALHASLYASSGLYDCAILNPPYAKINTGSRWRQALRTLGIETSNLYTAFVAVALDQLRPGGQLVAITPRSFCNGSYFEPFRRFMLKHAALNQVHVYESRKKAFGEDDVLQENIIFRMTKNAEQPDTVIVSSSHDPDDPPTDRRVPFSEIVLPGDRHRYIRLPISDEDGNLAQRVRNLPCTLGDLGITVSTGRVVDFRARNHLRMQPERGTVPLIYPAHFEQGFVTWPKLGGRKHNALALDKWTSDQVVPQGIYVLTKRFSSKEERRRLVAAIYDPQRVEADYVGFENHLNYFHLNGAGLPEDLAKGLMLFLNSTAVDQYFRQFSGHTQVNATDLRNLHYPSCEQLEVLGRRLMDALPPQEEIDGIVEELL